MLSEDTTFPYGQSPYVRHSTLLWLDITYSNRTELEHNVMMELLAGDRPGF